MKLIGCKFYCRTGKEKIQQHFHQNYAYNYSMTISYSLRQIYLDWMLIAATESGVCAISFGDDPTALEAGLRTHYAGSIIEKDLHAFAPWVSAVVDFIESPAHGINVPLDLQGTDFQIQVWQALRQIPCGETVTYAQLAVRMGRSPTSARAVARACATNNIAAVIPCHRVVGSDGSLTGYRWGVERKKLLLEREKKS
jgi:AraC family transcriptional regulator, regulatory protein of adaptative response / methylated-DNA-[protein]-cysteine methyltransferase